MNKLVLMTLAALSLNTAVQAQELPAAFELADDAVALLPIEGEVTAAQVDGFVFNPKCPPNALCAPFSRATIDLNFTLAGCVDDLGPVTYAYERSEDGRKATVYVSAINVVSRMSANVKCFVAKTEQRRIELRMSAGLEEVEVRFLSREAAAK